MIVSPEQRRSIVEFFETPEKCSRSRVLRLDLLDILTGNTYKNHCLPLLDENGFTSKHDFSTINSIELHSYEGIWSESFRSDFKKKIRLLDDVLCQASKNIEILRLFGFVQIGWHREGAPLSKVEKENPSSFSALVTSFALRITDSALNLKIIELDTSFLFSLQHCHMVKTFFSGANSLEHLSITSWYGDIEYCFSESRPIQGISSPKVDRFVFLRTMPQILHCIQTFSKRFRCFNLDHEKWMELPSSFLDCESGDATVSVSLDVHHCVERYLKEIWKEIAFSGKMHALETWTV